MHQFVCARCVSTRRAGPHPASLRNLATQRPLRRTPHKHTSRIPRLIIPQPIVLERCVSTRRAASGLSPSTRQPYQHAFERRRSPTITDSTSRQQPWRISSADDRPNQAPCEFRRPRWPTLWDLKPAKQENYNPEVSILQEGNSRVWTALDSVEHLRPATFC